MIKGSLMLGAGAVFGASTTPGVSLNLTPIIIALLVLIGTLVTAGFIASRYQKAKLVSETKKNDADARLADGQAVLTHAQYEGFIAEAAQRLETVNKAAIGRLETELARNQARIAELETELVRAKGERNEALAGAHIREIELQQEIADLKNRVMDLERRLEARGVKSRRHSDKVIEAHDEDDQNDRGGPDPPAK